MADTESSEPWPCKQRARRSQSEDAAQGQRSRAVICTTQLLDARQQQPSLSPCTVHVIAPECHGSGKWVRAHLVSWVRVRSFPGLAIDAATCWLTLWSSNRRFDRMAAGKRIASIIVAKNTHGGGDSSQA